MDDNAIGEFASVWPRAAYEARIKGEVTLSCLIDRHGLAEHCDVASETPQGKGFGDAALQLRPTFKLTPAHDAEGPIDATMRIAIEFNPPDPQLVEFGGPESGGANADGCGGMGKPCADFMVLGNTLNRRNITMLNNPVWARRADVRGSGAGLSAPGRRHGRLRGRPLRGAALRVAGRLPDHQGVRPRAAASARRPTRCRASSR